jgi:hypothetical protein
MSRDTLSRAAGTDRTGTTGRDNSPPLGAVPSGIPVSNQRLLSLREAAAYLACSYWSVRDWCLAGLLPTVTLPPLRRRAGEAPRTSLRRVLIDRADLDAFIERHKGRRP